MLSRIDATDLRDAANAMKYFRLLAYNPRFVDQGGIGMARAVSDEELSREILKTAAQRLKSPAS
jgi:hypothetical protein